MGSSLFSGFVSSSAVWASASEVLASSVSVVSWTRACAALIVVCVLAPSPHTERPWIPFLRGLLIAPACLWAFGMFSPLAVCLSAPCFAILEGALGKREANLLLIVQSWVARLALLGGTGYAALHLPGKSWLPGLWRGPMAGRVLVVVAGFILIIWVGRDIMAAMLKPMAAKGREPQGLPGSGALIGCFERMLVLLFVLGGEPSGVGYVLAAKSILCFNEIRNAKERSEVDYIMVGTFGSFAWAFLAAQATRIAVGLC